MFFGIEIFGDPAVYPFLNSIFQNNRSVLLFFLTAAARFSDGKNYTYICLFTCSMRDVKAFIPSVGLFLLVNGLLVLLQGMLTRYGFSIRVLLFGNLFLFGLSLISFLLQQKAARSASAQLFIRYFYISFLIKLILVAAVALVYAKTAASVNRISVIACMLLYLIYTFIEISVLLKAGKQKNA